MWEGNAFLQSGVAQLIAREFFVFTKKPLKPELKVCDGLRF